MNRTERNHDRTAADIRHALKDAMPDEALRSLASYAKSWLPDLLRFADKHGLAEATSNTKLAPLVERLRDVAKHSGDDVAKHTADPEGGQPSETKANKEQVRSGALWTGEGLADGEKTGASVIEPANDTTPERTTAPWSHIHAVEAHTHATAPHEESKEEGSEATETTPMATFEELRDDTKPALPLAKAAARATPRTPVDRARVAGAHRHTKRGK